MRVARQDGTVRDRFLTLDLRFLTEFPNNSKRQGKCIWNYFKFPCSLKIRNLLIMRTQVKIDYIDAGHKNFRCCKKRKLKENKIRVWKNAFKNCLQLFLKCENYNGKRKVFPKLSPKISPQRNSASPQTPSTRIRKPHILLKESASEPAHRNFIVLKPLSIVDFFWIRRVEQIR